MHKALAALEELQAAADVFADAILKFKETFDPDVVGLDEWIEHNETVLLELYDNIEANLGDDFDDSFPLSLEYDEGE